MDTPPRLRLSASGELIHWPCEGFRVHSRAEHPSTLSVHPVVVSVRAALRYASFTDAPFFNDVAKVLLSTSQTSWSALLAVALEYSNSFDCIHRPRCVTMLCVCARRAPRLALGLPFVMWTVRWLCRDLKPENVLIHEVGSLLRSIFLKQAERRMKRMICFQRNGRSERRSDA